MSDDQLVGKQSVSQSVSKSVSQSARNTEYPTTSARIISNQESKKREREWEKIDLMVACDYKTYYDSLSIFIHSFIHISFNSHQLINEHKSQEALGVLC